MDREMRLQSPEAKPPGPLSQHSTFFARLGELILEWPLPTQILDKEPLVVVQHRPFHHSSKGPEEMTENILGDSTEEISPGVEFSTQDERVMGIMDQSTETAKRQDVE